MNKKTGCHECQNVRWECAVGNEENLRCKRFVRSVPCADAGLVLSPGKDDDNNNEGYVREQRHNGHNPAPESPCLCIYKGQSVQPKPYVTVALTVLNLWIIKRNALLVANNAGAWRAEEERCNPPHREKDEPQEEAPGVHR